MTLHVYKAQPVCAEKPVNDLDLRATKAIPEVTDLKAAADMYDTDAGIVVGALLASLPGGTVDAVLRRLLEHRASLLRVRWPE